MWTQEVAAVGLRYTLARRTIFHDQVHTACGTQSAAVGPFSFVRLELEADCFAGV